MLVLGIDPGIAITGYGLIQTGDRSDYQCIDYGVIRTEPGIPDPDRLALLFKELKDLLGQYQVDSSAVEKLFFQKNVRTAFSVGQARGVTLLALAQSKVPISEYTPNEIKQTVCGYGNAGKSQVQRMVQSLLHLADLPKPDDAADALAVAICHINHQSFNNFVQKAET
ncbi:MAG: crossover junction endodeoxyribonuclease RuvC [Chloroflexota bacterium]|nr:crossover junction endodeoxyribonuclease RuvC [Chloroflexota bacterium]